MDRGAWHRVGHDWSDLALMHGLLWYPQPRLMPDTQQHPLGTYRMNELSNLLMSSQLAELAFEPRVTSWGLSKQRVPEVLRHRWCWDAWRPLTCKGDTSRLASWEAQGLVTRDPGPGPATATPGCVPLGKSLPPSGLHFTCKRHS